MSVLKGEGKVPILFGTTTIVVGSRTHRGYLARPDLAGEWPTIVVAVSAWGITGNVKDVARRIARQGLAVVVPDLYGGEAPQRSAPPDEAAAAFAQLPATRLDGDLADVVAFIQNPSGFWSSAEHGFGVLGLGDGGLPAARTAVGRGAAALGLVATPPRSVAKSLAGYDGAVLGLLGRDDDRGDTDALSALRDSVPQAELVIYSGVGADFLDDYLPSYDFDVAGDALERLAELFAKHLPPPPA